MGEIMTVTDADGDYERVYDSCFDMDAAARKWAEGTWSAREWPESGECIVTAPSGARYRFLIWTEMVPSHRVRLIGACPEKADVND